MTPFLETIGGVMLHFLWQGALIAFVAAVVLRCLSRGTSHLRYAVACSTLLLMLATSLVTASLVSGGAVSMTIGLTLSVVEPRDDSEPAAWHRGPSPVAAALGLVNKARSATPSPPALLPALAILWLTGVALLLARLAAGWRRLRRLRSRGSGADTSAWQARADAIAARVGIRQPIHVVDLLESGMPSVIGWLRPIVILPVAALANLTPAQVDAILTHEIAHVRRHDFVVNVMQIVVETLLFFHPAVWWISARIRIEREHCCDDLVVDAGIDRAEYSAALMRLAERRPIVPAFSVSAMSGPLLIRVRRLLQVPTEETMTPGFVTSATLVCCVLAGILWAGPRSVTQVVHAAAASHAVRQNVPTTALFDIAQMTSKEEKHHRGDRGSSDGVSGHATAPGVTTRFAGSDNNVIASAPAQVDSLNWKLFDASGFSVFYESSANTSTVSDVVASAQAATESVRRRYDLTLSFRPSLILVATSAQLRLVSGTVSPGPATPGPTGAFSGSRNGRIVLPLDESSDLLDRLLWHELGHVFLREIVRAGQPELTVESGLPPWLVEGFADHVVEVWRTLDIRKLREFVRDGGDTRMSRRTGIEAADPRITYALGHAAIDFIEMRAGASALKQLITGCASANVVPQDPRDIDLVCPTAVFESALALTPGGFDAAFTAYLKGWLPTVP